MTHHRMHELPAPLRPVRDMESTWTNLEVDFDTAAERLVQAHAADGTARDVRLDDLREWAVGSVDGALGLVPLTGNHEAMRLRSSALSSLMTRLHVPGDYVRRVPAPLQLAILNHGLLVQEDTSPVTLRLRSDEVSAIVSPRFAPLDPAQLVETLRGSLVRLGLLDQVRVRGLASGVVDNLRLIIPSENAAVKVGDVSAIGLDITSSSFAKSALHVNPIVLRLVCTNGLRRPSQNGAQLSFRHVGDTRRIRDGLEAAIPAALGGARTLLDEWSRAVTTMVYGVAERIRHMRELTAKDREQVEQALLLEVGESQMPRNVSLFDLVNAVTYSAKSAVPARRLELESVAGNLLAEYAGRS